MRVRYARYSSSIVAPPDPLPYPSPDGRGEANAIAHGADQPEHNNINVNTTFPIEPTPAEAQDTIRDEFAFFGDWSERYQYLIDLGRKLPEFPDDRKNDTHRLLGCQSMVWIVASGDADRLDFAAASDSAIVSGLIFLALRVYSGRSAEDIVATDARYIADIGLAKHLSPTRNNGLAALLSFIKATAQDALRERASRTH
jgi:cysteine desulfuration protein SufE